MLKNKKMLVILAVSLFAFILFLNSNVFADVTYTVDGTNYTFPDLPFDTTAHPNYFVYMSCLGVYRACFVNEYPFFKVYLGGNWEYNNNIETTYEDVYGSWGSFTVYNYDGSDWVLASTSFDKLTFHQSWQAYQAFFLFSTVDIYDVDNNTVFFKGTLPQAQVVLMQSMTVEEVPEMIHKLLIILVPVGLTIFGVLCLVYLLKSRVWRLM